MAHQKIIRYLAISIVIFFYSLLFPQTIFRDCLQIVFLQNIGEDQSESLLTEEDYLDLFHLEKSDYKVTWKFF